MSYAQSKREQGAPVSATDPSNYAPCRECHGSTPKTMLAQYGAQCWSCFDGYCKLVGSDEPVNRKAAIAKLKAFASAATQGKSRSEIWAALEAKAAAGEHLTQAQRVMLKAGNGRMHVDFHDEQA